MSNRRVYFATCAPGIEPILHREIRELKLAKSEEQVGGVRFEGDANDGMRANLWLRTAVRVLWRLGRFEAMNSDELHERVAEYEWENFISPEGSLVVNAQTRDSQLDHSRFIEQRVKDAICDSMRARFGVRPSVDRDDPDLYVHLHLYRNRATLSIDLSGPSLHKRGWRQFQGRAPLAETMAAASILYSDWDRRAPLLDPFCGSATIAVEAAWIATNRAPGRLRSFAFERLPEHDAGVWEKMREQAEAGILPTKKLRILASDRDPGRVDGARENLAAAEVDGLVELKPADARSFAPRRGWNAWIVTNPPYGERVGDVRTLRGLYRDFGKALRENAGGYRFAILSGDHVLASELKLRTTRRMALKNGALDVELQLGVVPEPAATDA